MRYPRDASRRNCPVAPLFTIKKASNWTLFFYKWTCSQHIFNAQFAIRNSQLSLQIPNMPMKLKLLQLFRNDSGNFFNNSAFRIPHYELRIETHLPLASVQNLRHCPPIPHSAFRIPNYLSGFIFFSNCFESSRIFLCFSSTARISSGAFSESGLSARSFASSMRSFTSSTGLPFSESSTILALSMRISRPTARSCLSASVVAAGETWALRMTSPSACEKSNSILGWLMLCIFLVFFRVRF